MRSARLATGTASPVVLANELTCRRPLSRIHPREREARIYRARTGTGRRQTGQEPVVQEKGGEIAEMLSLYWKLRSLTTRQEGQGMVEYALILVLVSIVVIVILLTMGNQIKNVFSNVVAALGA
jgi:pilus assembly protein Flp/PilA